MAKGTKVTAKEADRMFALYQELGSYKKVAKKLRRNPDTVARYVKIYEAAVTTVSVFEKASSKK